MGDDKRTEKMIDKANDDKSLMVLGLRTDGLLEFIGIYASPMHYIFEGRKEVNETGYKRIITVAIIEDVEPAKEEAPL